MRPSARVDQAIQLGDGRVLMAGGYDGYDGGSAIAASEAFDPRLGTWSRTAPLPAPRGSYAGSPLRNGDALIAGGSYQSDIFVYEVASDRWRLAGKLQHGRLGATATLLASGEVLIAGGSASSLTAELYVPDPSPSGVAVPGLSSTAVIALGVLLAISTLSLNGKRTLLAKRRRLSSPISETRH
jgi:hypothetical protein